MNEVNLTFVLLIAWLQMARKSGIPSMIYKLRTSIACMDLSCPNHGEWMRWVHYEYMKR